MNIVIFAGGTGSVALQEGLYCKLDANIDGVDTKVVVNAYDNGLSTGAVRLVLDGQILGPSDVRKNHATRLNLECPASPWLKFLNNRFTIESRLAPEFCAERVSGLLRQVEQGCRTVGCHRLFHSALTEFFNSPLAGTIDYIDFSLPNIVYAGLAKANGNSLRAAARIMAEVMGIPDNVILNDDRSLFLGAVTQSGRRVVDEGEIVSWGDECDPFVDVFFTNPHGESETPELCLEAWRAITEANLIILSSGTLWSSLIPTYASRGFGKAISSSKATILMVMNRTPDMDSPSQTANDIIDLLIPRYFESGRLHVLTDCEGHPQMRFLRQSTLSKVASFTQTVLSAGGGPTVKHDSKKLADAIGRIAFSEYLESSHYIFDYDDTLVARGDALPKAGRFNRKGLAELSKLANVCVCTGNTIHAVDLRSDIDAEGSAMPPSKPLAVFADGGINKYLYQAKDAANVKTSSVSPLGTVECIWSQGLLPSTGPYSIAKIVQALRRAGVPRTIKIENRGNAVIAMKPVPEEYRQAVLALARYIIDGSDLEVRETGRTTVEICMRGLTKACTLRYIYGSCATPPSITYVGDEFEFGNDSAIAALALDVRDLKCLKVDSPAKTAFFIATLILHLSKNVEQ